MISESLFELSGLSLTIGGLITTLGWVLFAFLDPTHQDYKSIKWLPLNLIVIFGGLFMALGLPGFYAYQAEKTGVWGLVGMVILFIGILVPYVGVQAVETLTIPNLPLNFMLFVAIGGPCLVIGSIITGIVTWNAGIYPKEAGAGMVFMAFIGLLNQFGNLPPWLKNVISAVYTGIISWLGISLMSLF